MELKAEEKGNFGMDIFFPIGLSKEVEKAKHTW